MKKKNLLSLCIVAALSFSACKNDSTSATNNAATNTNTPATNSGTETPTSTAAPVAESYGKLSDTKYNFEHFLSFDLKDWKQESSKDYEGGDAWGKDYVYTKNGQRLEFTDGLGSYGYNQDYRLYDANGKLLKERRFFYADGYMSEEVKDYENKKHYTRSLETMVAGDKWESKDKPLMAEGAWDVQDIETITAAVAPFGMLSNTQYSFEHFISFDLNNWVQESKEDYEEGDAWGKDCTYTKEGYKLTIDDGNSSYGYNQNHKLYDASGKLLKERDFYFAGGYMSETVIDHEAGKKYERGADATVAYDLWETNNKPLIVEGEWKISDM